MHVHLRTGPKKNAVAVEQIDLAVRLQLAKNQARIGVIDTVKRSPLWLCHAIFFLIENDNGTRSNIERLPVDGRLRGILVDRQSGADCRIYGGTAQCATGKKYRQRTGSWSIRHRDRTVKAGNGRRSGGSQCG